MERFGINEVTCTILRIKEDVTLHTYFMASRIEVNGFVSAKIGALPPGQKCIVAVSWECSLCKTWPTSRRMDQA